jgi:hypothetical protein
MVLQKIVDVNDNSIEVESKSGNVYSVYFNDFPHTDDIPKVERRVDKNKEAFAEIKFDGVNPEIVHLYHYVPRSVEQSRQ